MSRRPLRLMVAMAGFFLALPAGAGAPAASSPAAARAIPPELTQRFASLHAALTPSARAWVDQQALLEARKPGLDLAGLKDSVRSRFPSLKGGKRPSLPSPGNDDIAAIAFVVLMQATNSADQDLQAVMQQIKAMNAAKTQLRGLIGTLNQFQQKQLYSEGDTPCTSPFCKALPQRLEHLAQATSALAHPVRIPVPSRLTYSHLPAIEGQLKSHLDSLNQASQEATAKRRKLTVHRAQLMNALSGLSKSIPSTAENTLANLK